MKKSKIIFMLAIAIITIALFLYRGIRFSLNLEV